MEKREILERIQKVDLTDEQLEIIEGVLSGELEKTSVVDTAQVVKSNLKKELLYEKKAVNKLIYNLFKVCDTWVSIDNFVRFEDDFSKETNKMGFDLHKIYYGKTYQEMKNKYARYSELKK